MAWAIKNAAMMVTMTERDDIDVIVSNNALIPNGRTGEEVCLYIYDKYEGGLGYSEKIYDLVPQIVDAVMDVLPAWGITVWTRKWSCGGWKI